MNDTDYPALYRSAEAASAATQKAHLRLIAVQSILLVGAAALAMWPSNWSALAIASAALFLVSLALTVYARTQHYQRNWYQARALAESIKTTSWLYMMAADPYHGSDADAAKLFRSTLTQLLSDNRSLGDHFAATPAADEQLTAQMINARALGVPQKLTCYRDERITDQRSWYSRKAQANRKTGRMWFATLIVVYALAVLSSLVKIGAPEFKFYPSSVLAVTASGILTWIQVKRFSEIAAAYALTAHEIGIIEQGLSAITNEDELSKFVADAESAFSREHTQWAARRRE